MVNYESENLTWKFWRLMYQTYTLMKRCEDQIFGEHGLTTEQYAVLVTIKYLGEPLRISDVARWLERSTNSISMIVDRMVKAGLLRRTRGGGDRREVYVSITSKGNEALKPATLGGAEFIQKILSPLSYDDRHIFVSQLETLKYEILGYLNPGVDMKEMRKNEPERETNLRKWLLQYASSSTPEAKCQGGKKKKAI
jgi:DNA-binding MarR family transcriptional regulator